MIPIIPGQLYAIDIETAPLPQYVKKNSVDEGKVKNYSEERENDEIEDTNSFDGAGLLPWTSKIIGIGVCWGNDMEYNTAYFVDEDIVKLVKFIADNKLQLAGHNIFFDWCHLYYHFELPLNFIMDSGVISQCINNSDFVRSFGLKQTTQRLYNVITQETEIQEYLKIHHKIPPSRYGQYLYLVPSDILSKYCRLDAYYCLKIINDSPKYLVSNISKYMELYVCEVRLTIRQFIEGICVNRESFIIERERIKKEIQQIENEFLTHEDLQYPIYQVQVEKFNKAQDKLKRKMLDFSEWEKTNKFNINSSAQLKMLFNFQGLHFNKDTNKFEYPFVNVKTGTKINNLDSPKLGAKFLYAYGIGGKILGNRGEKVTLVSHIDRALEESELTGRIHAHINLLGTKSGRVSGSGVNIIATPISDAQYGKNLIIDDPEYEIMSVDFAALEPTILAALSNDPILKYTCFEGIGKEPYVENGKLWISDIYLTSAYAADFMRPELEDKLILSNWVHDSEGEKKKVKHIRNIAKAIVLKSNYSAGAQKIKQGLMEDLKVDVPLKHVQLFLDNYWDTISVAAKYKREIEQRAQDVGYLINIGGFPLIFYESPGGIIDGIHKALNRMIQSSANICMKLLIYFYSKYMKNRNDVFPLISNWHDAMWLKVKKTSLEEIKSIFINKILPDVNKVLEFSINLSLSINHGSTFYDAK